ncbi:hypothetical protein B5781_0456 [Bifidobacterium longum]|nr:hypothetical protein B5781_0456 [Bifidobacterium longum]
MPVVSRRAQEVLYPSDRANCGMVVRAMPR